MSFVESLTGSHQGDKNAKRDFITDGANLVLAKTCSHRSRVGV